MEVNNLISSMLQDYAYILKGLVYDESMKEPVSEIIIKIPMEIQSEFENKYNITICLLVMYLLLASIKASWAKNLLLQIHLPFSKKPVLVRKSRRKLPAK